MTAIELTDEQIISAVNEIARMLHIDEQHREIAKILAATPTVGMRFDISHLPSHLVKWKLAVELFKERTGIDGQEALARHEAAIRANNPVLNR